MSKKLHYYEMCFNEDANGEGNDAYSFCIKTEIEGITKEQALAILPPQNESDELSRIIEVTEEEALASFDLEDLTIRVENTIGVYYSRSTSAS